MYDLNIILQRIRLKTYLKERHTANVLEYKHKYVK